LKIPFNKPWLTGKEFDYIRQAAEYGQLSGNGMFTRKCRDYFEEHLAAKAVLLTTSCTDALEMAAILAGTGPGDEVIVPAFTFVSTPLAFTRTGATVVFADSKKDDPCLDESGIEDLITEKTKVIVPVHYGGRVCNMDKITEVASKYRIRVIEDAAHAWGSSYRGKPAGTFGETGCFSFHETKLLHCGEGGMIAVNDASLVKRAEEILDKGTNRASFYRGEVPYYEWTDIGSSFLLSDINAAFLAAQSEQSGFLLNERRKQWTGYFTQLTDLETGGYITLPMKPEDGFNCYSFHIITGSLTERQSLITYLSSFGIQAVAHYRNLAVSKYAMQNLQSKGVSLTNASNFQDRLLRLPMWVGLGDDNLGYICDKIKNFYRPVNVNGDSK
jgi:dTDP-4-amino-4,6-dideoxygalactose transaminase